MAIRPAVARRLERLSRRLGADPSDSWSVRLGWIAWAAGTTLTKDAARPGRVGRTSGATVNRAKKEKKVSWQKEALAQREAAQRPARQEARREAARIRKAAKDPGAYPF